MDPKANIGPGSFGLASAPPTMSTGVRQRRTWPSRNTPSQRGRWHLITDRKHDVFQAWMAFVTATSQLLPWIAYRPREPLEVVKTLSRTSPPPRALYRERSRPHNRWMHLPEVLPDNDYLEGSEYTTVCTVDGHKTNHGTRYEPARRRQRAYNNEMGFMTPLGGCVTTGPYVSREYCAWHCMARNFDIRTAKTLPLCFKYRNVVI